jgi:hypothetical protein
MIQTVESHEALENLLHDLNERGDWPSVAVLTSTGVTALIYGVDMGDEMRLAAFNDPGDDRIRGDATDYDGSYIGEFERDITELAPPFTVMYADRSE